MTAQETRYAWYAAGAFALYWLFLRKDPTTGQSGLDTLVSNIGSSAGSAPVNFVTGAAGGAVIAAGQAVGIPATSQSKCDADIAAGDTWSASFDCTASEFIAYLRG